MLYPGIQNKKWRGFHEIMPGLGAFAIRPTGEDNAGTAELAIFIGEVVQHVCDRATRREQESYHVYKVHETPAPFPGDTRASGKGSHNSQTAHTAFRNFCTGWVVLKAKSI